MITRAVTAFALAVAASAASAQGTAADAERARAEAAARAAAEQAREEAERQRNAEPRFYKEPYRPSQRFSPPQSDQDRRNAELFSQAQGLERDGKGADAAKIYIRAARGGSVPAARRLAEIYEQGIDGVMPDRAESKKWGNAARVLEEPRWGPHRGELPPGSGFDRKPR